MHVVNAPLPTRHSNVAVPSLDENVNTGGLTFVGPLGPELIVVSGATVSTVQPRVAGEASVLPAASRARTANVCAPCDRPV